MEEANRLKSLRARVSGRPEFSRASSVLAKVAGAGLSAMAEISRR